MSQQSSPLHLEKSLAHSLSECLATSEMILGSLPLPIIGVDEHNQIRYANGAAEYFFSTGRLFLAKRKIDDVIPYDSPLLTLLDESRRHCASMQEYDLDISTPIIGHHTVNALVAPVADIPGFVLILLQERLLSDKMSRQLSLRGTARTVSGMAAILAHEIKNPLAGISGAAQLLAQQAGEEDIALTTLIRREADRICALVDQMEMFSDIRPLKTRPLNIHTVLDHVRQVAEASFARDVHFEERYDPSLPELFGDRDQLIQVFLNLIKNAVDAIGSREEGRITLSTAYQPGMRMSVPGLPDRVNLPLEVCVIDNGHGIAADLMPHLFDPFVTTKSQGKGLGLALVAKIIADHGGVIDCQSEPNKTVFRVLLPLDKSHIASARTKSYEKGQG